MTSKRHGLFLAVFLLVLLGSERGGGSAEERFAQGRILATYEVDLASFSLGEIHLSAKLNGGSYEMEGEGRFSLLVGGLYRGSGTTASTGRLTKGGPESSTFALSFEGGGNKEARRLSFANGAVRKVSIIPPKRQGRRRIPISKEQLEDVLDPLSAVFLYRPRANALCDDILPVFDGRLRFNLVLTPKRAETLPEDVPQGLPGRAAVCQVKFVPIGGHRPDNPTIKFATKTDEIEVWLVPLPQSDLYVPYRIVGPTPLGRGSATLTELKANLD
jgi:hypothetical protein